MSGAAPQDQQPKEMPLRRSWATSAFISLVVRLIDQQGIPPRRSWGITKTLAPLLVGIVVGAAAGFPMFFGVLDQATPFMDWVLHIGLPLLGVAGTIVVICALLVVWVVKRIFGRLIGTLEQVVHEASAATRAIIEKNPAAAVLHVERIALEVVAWYGTSTARRFAVGTGLALLATFGTLIGSALLFRQTLLLGNQNTMIARQVELLSVQNDLLTDQNHKVDRQVELLTDQNHQITLQTVTADAQRRGALSEELFSILQAVTATDDNLKTELRLSRGLTARIVAFSLAAEPYWIVRVPDRDSNGVTRPQLENQARSPERGQLLVGLLISGANIVPIIEAGATFAGAALTGANLWGLTITGANLSGGDLSNTILTANGLSRVNFSHVNLSRADLFRADLTGANLTGANLTGADLTGANLTGANLTGANLTGANLTGANLTDAKLSDAIVAPEQVIPEGWESYQDGQQLRLRRRQ